MKKSFDLLAFRRIASTHLPEMTIMRRCIFSLAFLILSTSYSLAQDWAGSYSGDLRLPMGSLKLVLHLMQHDAQWSATLDSPMQGAKGLPLSSVSINGDTIMLVADRLGLTYRAKRSGDKLTGTFSQGGLELPLDLLREPQKNLSDADLPYTEREIIVEVQPDSIHLSGTLTRPKGVSQRLPLVIFITGSGPQNRDEELMGHKPFAVLADSLTRSGFMTYRYDDRGIGKSSGIYMNATLSSFVRDARHVYNRMRSLPDVDPQKIYLLGHSEGAYVAARVAVLEGEVGAVVCMAGPIEPIGDLMIRQLDKLSELAGVSEELRQTNRVLNRTVYQEAANMSLSRDELRGRLLELLNQYLQEVKIIPEPQRKDFVEQTIAQVSSDYFRELLNADPPSTWRAVKCPVIGFWGSLDVQVSSENAKYLKALIPKSEIKVFEGINHLMQPAKTGAIQEYEQEPKVIRADVVQWLITRLRKL